jgi:hypothetical protein
MVLKMPAIRIFVLFMGLTMQLHCSESFNPSPMIKIRGTKCSLCTNDRALHRRSVQVSAGLDNLNMLFGFNKKQRITILQEVCA